MHLSIEIPNQVVGFTSQHPPVGWSFVKICDDVKSIPHLGPGCVCVCVCVGGGGGGGARNFN